MVEPTVEVSPKAEADALNRDCAAIHADARRRNRIGVENVRVVVVVGPSIAAHIGNTNEESCRIVEPARRAASCRRLCC